MKLPYGFTHDDIGNVGIDELKANRTGFWLVGISKTQWCWYNIPIHKLEGIPQMTEQERRTEAIWTYAIYERFAVKTAVRQPILRSRWRFEHGCFLSS
jgi:hypothetical protein